MKRKAKLLIFLLACCTQLLAQSNQSYYKKMPVFYPLNYGDVQPSGWLKDWCVKAKNGLVLHNSAFKEGWGNGRPPTFLNEQSAYWIDGMMRLGLVLHDEELITKASEDIKSVIKNDYLKPSSWAAAVYSRAILAYYHGTSDRSALDYLSHFFENANVHGYSDVTDMKQPNDPRGKFISITQPRNLVQVEAMLETYSLTGNKKILDNALDGLNDYSNRFISYLTGKKSNQVDKDGCYLGFDNSTLKAIPTFKDAFSGCISTMHGVSYNEFGKLWAIGYLYNDNPEYLKASVNAYAKIDSLHMMPYGVNSSWENLMGVSPELGTETCDVSDFINSNIWMYRITGNSAYGDKIEKAFFNAAAGAVDHEFKHLVYLQSANCNDLVGMFKFQEVHEPKCCNGNAARLLPNYILHMTMATADNGIALNMYGPSTINTLIGAKAVAFETITDYPFKDNIKVKFKRNDAGSFPLYLRLPSWSKNYQIFINGKSVDTEAQNGFIKLERAWKGEDEISLQLHAVPTIKYSTTKSNNAPSSLNPASKAIAGKQYCTVERGPLLFALNISKNKQSRYLIANDHFLVQTSNTTQNFNGETRQFP